MLKNFEFALLMLLFVIEIFKKDNFQIFLLKKFCILCCDSWEFFEPESTFIYTRGHANIIIVLRKEK